MSTVVQDTRLQLDALRRVGVRRIFEDKSSGVGPRPELHRALASLRQGDTFVVWKLDRVARSLFDLLAIITRVGDAGATIRSLTEPIDTSSPYGRFTLQVLGAVAELERNMIRERTLAGQAAARERGSYVGRPPHLTLRQCEQVAQLLRRGKTVDELAERFDVKPWVIRRAPLRLQN